MKKTHTVFLSALLAMSACGLSTPTVAALSLSASGQSSSELSKMLQGVMPAVVNIAAQGEIILPDNPFAEPAPKGAPVAPMRQRQFESLGSGVILDAKNGYIVTNAHVLRDANIITATLSDGRVFKAKLLGMDPASDIAIVQIKTNKLTALPMGNSDQLKVGDFVAAIGSPFGLNQTVTSGIVSGLQRNNLGIEGYENFIQTDASINPGNSGGALVNMQGQLIGINTAILAPGGGNIGIGFAIPINMVHGAMMQLIKYGSIRRGVMGVMVQDLTPALAEAFHLPGNTTGALVTEVLPDSPAAMAGLHSGDLIQSLNDQAITSGPQLKNTIGMLRAGTPVTIKLLRDGKSITLKVETADPVKYSQVTEQANPFLAGVTLQDFNQFTSAHGHVVGVQVLGVMENSIAFRSGIRPGDVITSANQKPVTTFKQLKQIAKESKEQLLLNVLRRAGGASYILIK